MFAIKRNEKISFTLPKEVYWTTSNSYLQMYDDNPSTIDMYVFYTDLATEVTKEVHSYQLSNLFGDFAGMAGTLLGLDLLKCVFMSENLPQSLRALFRPKNRVASLNY